MSMLSAIPVFLLVAFAIWFVWPVLADPISRLTDRRNDRSDADREAEHLFDAWTRHGCAAGRVRNDRG